MIKYKYNPILWDKLTGSNDLKPNDIVIKVKTNYPCHKSDCYVTKVNWNNKNIVRLVNKKSLERMK